MFCGETKANALDVELRKLQLWKYKSCRINSLHMTKYFSMNKEVSPIIKHFLPIYSIFRASVACLYFFKIF